MCPVLFSPTGGGGALLNIKGWNFDDESLRHDVTSTGTGGRRARIAGVNDARGTVTYSVDLDALPFNVNIRIVSGLTGIISVFISPISAIAYPIIIAKVHYEVAIESELKGSFDWEMSNLPQIGGVAYPLVA